MIRLRRSDLAAFSFPLFLLAVSIPGSRVSSGWLPSVLLWLSCITGGALCIYLGQGHDRGWRAYAAAFWPIPCIFLVYLSLNPFIDLVQPHLLDPYLIMAEAWLLGGHLSVWAERWLPPVLVDCLMLAYASYYFWPIALCARLFGRRDEAAFSHVAVTVILAFWFNYVFYALVPAIGPRFTLAPEFQGPVEGWLIGHYLYRSYLFSPVLRDCFPSGHTAVTLLVLYRAWRYDRRFFAVMLVPGCLLIAATVLLRFHYLIDIFFALPFALAVGAFTTWLCRVTPLAWTWRLPLPSARTGPA
ncbi:MAG: phosphatase PAP2 family protein [Deltaproteobacteria bacterium]|nr:MAG: phosphatase PAP2 family protein [Deltaproteobacteria bacterium]